jgi:hypothetical protein
MPFIDFVEGAEQIDAFMDWVFNPLYCINGDYEHGECNNEPPEFQFELQTTAGDNLYKLISDVAEGIPPKNINTQIYRPPAKISTFVEIPERKLPQEADGQTDYDTPDGRSISLQESLKNRKFGNLLWNPLSNESQKVNAPNLNNLSKDIDTARKEAGKRFLHNIYDTLEKDKDGKIKNPLNMWEKSVIAFTDTPSGLGGELKLRYGLRWFRMLVNANKKSSQTALMKVCDYIPKEVKVNSQNVDFKQSFSDEIVDISGLGEIGKVLGIDEFPGNLPYLLNLPFDKDKPEDEQGNKIYNYVDFWLYLINQLDGLIGEFPISIKIKDTDLTKEGDQTKTMKIANIAEGIAELFGNTFSSVSMIDANMNILLRFIPEISRIRQLGLTNQDILIAIREYIGFREKEIEKELNSNFTLTKDTKNIAKMLEPEKIKYKSMQFDGKQSLIDVLLKLEYIANLQKNQLITSFKDFEDFIDKNGDENSTNNVNLDSWNKFVREINDPLSQFNFEEKASKIRDVEGDGEDEK